MNLELDRDVVIGAIRHLLASNSRINEAKPQRYWYPLSMATYGEEEILEALDSMCAFRTTMWEKTKTFESEFAKTHGAKHAIMVNSGSSADLLLSFLLVDPSRPRLRKGDEVLVPAVTWPTHVWSPMMAGLKVRLVDVDPRTLNVSVDALAAAITPATRAIFLVHLMGNPCEMDRILALCKQHDLLLLEDCCEALGASWKGTYVGNFGVGGSFSFFFSHHVTTMEGGMITTNDSLDAERLRILRAHGWLRNVDDQSRFDFSGCEDIDPRYAFVGWGFNVRPTELQAGFGLKQLEKLPMFTERRTELAAKFFSYVDRSPFFRRPAVDPQATPVWMALPLMISGDAPFSRREFTAYLENEGVETRPVVTGNLVRQPATKFFPELHGDFEGAEQIHRQGFYVGLSPLVPASSIDRLIDCFERFLVKFR